jgi:hypothetical protein
MARDIYNDSSSVELRGALDVEAICRCAQPAASRLYPSYGHWLVALNNSRPSREQYWATQPTHGPYAFVCDSQSAWSNRDPVFLNWCAEVERCAAPERDRHPLRGDEGSQ